MPRFLLLLQWMECANLRRSTSWRCWESIVLASSIWKVCVYCLSWYLLTFQRNFWTPWPKLLTRLCKMIPKRNLRQLTIRQAFTPNSTNNILAHRGLFIHSLRLILFRSHFSLRRFTYGAAPYATCAIMNDNGDILHLSHVDDNVMEASTLQTKAGTKAKSKGKVAHYNAFVHLRDQLTVCCYMLMWYAHVLRRHSLVSRAIRAQMVRLTPSLFYGRNFQILQSISICGINVTQWRNTGNLLSIGAHLLVARWNIPG